MRKLPCIIQVGPKHSQMLPYERGRGKRNTDPGTGNVVARLGLEARCQQHLEMAKEWFSPEPPKRAQPGRFNFSPIKIISDSWPLQLWENTFLLLQVTKFMLIRHSNHRKNEYRHNTHELVTCKHTHDFNIIRWTNSSLCLCWTSELVPAERKQTDPALQMLPRGMLAVIWGHGRDLA